MTTTSAQKTSSVNRFSRPEERSSQAERAKSAEEELKTRRAALEASAFRAIGSLRKMRIELGRIFIQLKATLKHGEWGHYYEKVFGDSSVSARSASRYMKLAAKTDSDSLSNLKPGIDQHAVTIHNATEKAKEAVGGAATTPEPVYRLALHLNAAQREATIKLWISEHRPNAERALVALLDRLHIRYGIINSDELKPKKEKVR